MTTVNSNKVPHIKEMQQIIQISNFVVYEMGGVIFVRALNIEDKVSIVVILIVTRPIIDSLQ
jgi:hypothetical protein